MIKASAAPVRPAYLNAEGKQSWATTRGPAPKFYVAVVGDVVRGIGKSPEEAIRVAFICHGVTDPVVMEAHPRVPDNVARDCLHVRVRNGVACPGKSN